MGVAHLPRLWTRFVAVVALAAIGAPVLGQAPPIALVKMASIFVTVEDADHRLVRGLSKDAFEVLVDNQRQSISQFDTSVQSLMLILLLDTSASMDAVFSPLKIAAADFIAGLPRRDIRRVGLMQPGEVQFSRMDDASSPGDLRAYVMSANRAAGATALWDALDESLDDLRFGTGRRVIVVCSDSADTAGQVNPLQITDKAQDFGVTVYAIHPPQLLNPSKPPARSSAGLRSLTEDTGGAVLDVASTNDFSRVFSRLAEELHTQYVLTFVPARLDGRVRALSVKVNVRGVTVRAPKSYVAAPDR